MSPYLLLECDGPYGAAPKKSSCANASIATHKLLILLTS